MENVSEISLIPHSQAQRPSVAEGFRSLFYALSPAESSFKDVSQVPKYMDTVILNNDMEGLHLAHKPDVSHPFSRDCVHVEFAEQVRHLGILHYVLLSHGKMALTFRDKANQFTVQQIGSDAPSFNTLIRECAKCAQGDLLKTLAAIRGFRGKRSDVHLQDLTDIDFSLIPRPTVI